MLPAQVVERRARDRILTCTLRLGGVARLSGLRYNTRARIRRLGEVSECFT